MNQEKQIEEMATAICDICRPKTDCATGKICTMAYIEAEALYNKDYRKQKEGEWVVTRIERGWNCAEYPTEYTCSLCGRVQPFAERYCPDCGAKMKGGAKA